MVKLFICYLYIPYKYKYVIYIYHSKQNEEVKRKKIDQARNDGNWD